MGRPLQPTAATVNPAGTSITFWAEVGVGGVAAAPLQPTAFYRQVDSHLKERLMNVDWWWSSMATVFGGLLLGGLP